MTATRYVLAVLSAGLASATTLREIAISMSEPQEVIPSEEIEQYIGGAESDYYYSEEQEEEEPISLEQSLEEELLGEEGYYGEPEMTILDMGPEELEWLFPEFIMPSPVFETIPGDNPYDPMVLTKETYVPLPLMIEPAEMPAEVEEMLKIGEKMDKEAK